MGIRYESVWCFLFFEEVGLNEGMMNFKVVWWLFCVIILLVILFWLVFWIVGFFLVCGLFDFVCYKWVDNVLIVKYFFGNGLLIWVFSLINLLFDLIFKWYYYWM